MANKCKPYTIGEEIKKGHEERLSSSSKYIPISVNTVQRRIEEMANDGGKTLTSELQHCKLAVQLDESTFGSSSILMAYVWFHSLSMNNAIVADYLETD